MRRRDVAVGGTYLVDVPYGFPPGRYLVDAGSAESIAAWLSMSELVCTPVATDRFGDVRHLMLAGASGTVR